MATWLNGDMANFVSQVIHNLGKPMQNKLTDEQMAEAVERGWEILADKAELRACDRAIIEYDQAGKRDVPMPEEFNDFND